MRVWRTSRQSGKCAAFLAIFMLILSAELVKTASEHDPYYTLGVSRSASQAEIKRAYKRLAREW